MAIWHAGVLILSHKNSMNSGDWIAAIENSNESVGTPMVEKSMVGHGVDEEEEKRTGEKK